MHALVKQAGEVSLRTVPPLAPVASDDVVIDVAVAGICRTDLYVADGLLPSADPVVLGHELAGTVTQVGAAAAPLRPGDRVTVVPSVPCGACVECTRGERCASPALLGVDRDGAFAGALRVPARAVLLVPPALPFRLAAYTEPLAAALGVLRAGLDLGGRGAVVGTGRIPTLIVRVLAAAGFGDVPACDPARPLPPGLDWVVESVADARAMDAMLRALRPGGTLVLKSRSHTPVPLDVGLAVRKDLVLRAVSYGSFEEAVAWLATGRVDVSDLLGETFALGDHRRAFAAARASEARKVFLRIDAGPERAD